MNDDILNEVTQEMETTEIMQDEQTEPAAGEPIAPETSAEDMQDVQNEGAASETENEAETSAEDVQNDDAASDTETEAAKVEAVTVIIEQSDTVASTRQVEYQELVLTTESRPFLTTPFEEYTVTEGYMLLFLLCFVIAAIYHMLRRFI